MATPEERVQLVRQLMAQMHTADEVLCRSLLESTDWNLEACAAMVDDSRRASLSLEAKVPVEVHFEEQVYELALAPTAPMAVVKAAIEKETGIAPDEQMLIEGLVQEEPPASATVADILEKCVGKGLGCAASQCPLLNRSPP